MKIMIKNLNREYCFVEAEQGFSCICQPGLIVNALLFSWRLFRLEIAMMYRTPRKDASVDAIVRQPSQCFS